jgi:hypothetical protein
MLPKEEEYQNLDIEGGSKTAKTANSLSLAVLPVLASILAVFACFGVRPDDHVA